MKSEDYIILKKKNYLNQMENSQLYLNETDLEEIIENLTFIDDS